MAASNGSNTVITSSGLKVVSSRGKEVLGEKSSENNDLTACSTSSISERMSRVEIESDPCSTLDANLWNMLNIHLAEKIIARLPFKSLFRASVLSKTWLQKLLNHSFQSEVLSSTSTWESYSPLFINDKKELIGYESGSKRWHRLPTQSYFPPSVEWGPCASVEERAWTWRLNLIAVGGSILCWIWTTVDNACAWTSYEDDDDCECRSRHPRPPFYPFYLCVSNPLTKSWKQLPPCPHTKVDDCPADELLFKDISVHVECQGTNAYQVVVIKDTGLYNGSIPDIPDISLHIFDSRSDIWTVEKYRWKRDETWRGGRDMWRQCVYMNGVIYLAITCLGEEEPYQNNQVDKRNQFNLISFDLENRIWSEQNFFINQQEGFTDHQRLKFWDSYGLVRLVVCGSNVMLVEMNLDTKNICVYRLDLEFGLAFAVSTAPRDILDVFGHILVKWMLLCYASGVGDCIYLGVKSHSRRSLKYTVTTQKWDWIPPAPDEFGPFSLARGNGVAAFSRPSSDSPWNPWSLTAYQPGLNPFLEV